MLTPVPPYGCPRFWIIITTLPTEVAPEHPGKRIRSGDWYSWEDYASGSHSLSDLRSNPFDFFYHYYSTEFKRKGMSACIEKCPLWVVNLDYDEIKVILPKDMHWKRQL
jgi:hypothetical protein